MNKSNTQLLRNPKMCSSTIHGISFGDPNSTTFSFATLDTWAEQHLTTVLTAQSQSNFTTAFDDFISNDVSITYNGVEISRDDYRQQLLDGISPESLAVMDILNIVKAAEFSQKTSQVSLTVKVMPSSLTSRE